MDQATVRRLRQLYAEAPEGITEDAGTDVDVAGETVGSRVP
jgi:hypothetical protein